MAAPPINESTVAVQTVTIDYDKLAAAILRQQKKQETTETETATSSTEQNHVHPSEEEPVTTPQVLNIDKNNIKKQGFEENGTKRKRLDQSYSKQVKKRIKLWHQRTHTSACLVYLRGNSVKIEGPPHIKDSLENNTSFKLAFLQAASAASFHDNISSIKIPQHYHKSTVSVLRDIITKIVTTDSHGERVQPHWGDVDMKPSWWPDEIHFKSPFATRNDRHPHLKKSDLVCLVGHFLEHQKQLEMKGREEADENLEYNLVEVLSTGIS